MPTIAQQWVEQGKKIGEKKGFKEGEKQGVGHRFGHSALAGLPNPTVMGLDLAIQAQIGKECGAPLKFLAAIRPS